MAELFKEEKHNYKRTSIKNNDYYDDDKCGQGSDPRERIALETEKNFNLSDINVKEKNENHTSLMLSSQVRKQIADARNGDVTVRAVRMSTSSLLDDPRMPQRVKTYKLESEPDDHPADWMALLSLVSGIIGMTLKYKVASWISLYCVLASITKMSRVDVDLKQVFTSLMFSVMSIVINYAAPDPHTNKKAT